jgi:hypothetical protein
MKGSIQKWALWVLVVFLPALAIAYSTWHVFRDAFPIIALLLTVSVGVSAWTVVQSDEPDARLRQAGLAAKFALAVVGFANLAVHVQVARETSGAKEAVVSRHTEEDREQERRDKQARRDKLLAEARAAEMAAQKDAMRAEAVLNNSLPVRQRKRTVTPASTPTPDPLAADPVTKPASVATIAASPEEIRERWSWWVFAMTVLESFIAVVGGAALLVLRHWDADGNGIADWIERLPETEVRRRFPREHQILYPQTATASGRRAGFAPLSNGSNYTFPNSPANRR